VYVDSSVIMGMTGGYQEGRGFGGIEYMPCRPDTDFFPDLPTARRVWAARQSGFVHTVCAVRMESSLWVTARSARTAVHLSCVVIVPGDVTVGACMVRALKVSLFFFFFFFFLGVGVAGPNEGFLHNVARL